MDREVVEGRKINPKYFITQYFSARDVVNRLKIEFGSKVRVDLLLKNTDNSHRLYKAGVDQIDNHIPEKYKPADLEKMLGLVQSNRMSILAKKRTAKSTVFFDFIRNASSREKKPVYSDVLKRATERQQSIIRRAQSSG